MTTEYHSTDPFFDVLPSMIVELPNWDKVSKWIGLGDIEPPPYLFKRITIEPIVAPEKP